VVTYQAEMISLVILKIGRGTTADQLTLLDASELTQRSDLFLELIDVSKRYFWTEFETH
jgi:hypothetical protein